MKWTANCRGVDEHGTPLVAVYGSEQMDAVDRSRLIAEAPDLLEALKLIKKAFADGDIKFTKKRQADSDPYHPANIKMCAAIAAAEGR